ncbi:MAG: PorT family protein [Alloprevotella sp.]|nr:PorT family protein [Alloprevotella sp.]MBR6376115.1 PorT family protein [Alloprevotella sp.]
MSLLRTTITTLLLLLAVACMAQERKIQNKPFIDERRFHYGFFVGVHDQELKLKNNGLLNESTGDQWVGENDTQNFGFSVGILGEWKITKWLALRITPSLHFGSKHLKFRNLNTGETQSQNLKSTYIGLPIALKMAAPRFNNFRPYVVAGVQPMVDLTSGKHGMIQTKPFGVNLEAGLGCDIYLPFFKLIPELKFSFGLADILNRKRTDLTDERLRVYTESTLSAHSNMVVLSFYFE